MVSREMYQSENHVRNAKSWLDTIDKYTWLHKRSFIDDVKEARNYLINEIDKAIERFEFETRNEGKDQVEG